jgi:hypothetical protein
LECSVEPDFATEKKARGIRFVADACVLRVEADEAVSCSKQFAVKPREKAVSIPHS